MLDYIAYHMSLHENTYVLMLFCHRPTREPLSLTLLFTMKIMSGRINMTQAQLEALVQAQVAAALAAAQAGSIPCSIDTH